MKLKGVGGKELLENVFEGENGVSNGTWFSLEILQELEIHSNPFERKEILDYKRTREWKDGFHQSKELTRYRDDSSFCLGQALGLDLSTLHETSFHFGSFGPYILLVFLDKQCQTWKMRDEFLLFPSTPF